jgi:hypothetical protein
MTCPHCESTATPERSDRTALGYRRLRQAHAEAHQSGDDRDKRWGAPCSRLPSL